MSDVIQQLAEVLEERKSASPDESYVASLHDKGLNKILEKIGEEASETIVAAKDCDGSPQTTTHFHVRRNDGRGEDFHLFVSKRSA